MSARIHGLTCEEVLALLSDHLDGDLAPGVLASVEQHLSACDGCTKFGAEFRATVAALRAHAAAGPRLPPRLRARLDALLGEEPDPKE